MRLDPMGLGSHNRSPDKIRSDRDGEGERKCDALPLRAVQINHMHSVMGRGVLHRGSGRYGRLGCAHVPCFEAVLMNRMSTFSTLAMWLRIGIRNRRRRFEGPGTVPWTMTQLERTDP
jgi:hypothetical protein